MTDIFHNWKENKFIIAPSFAYDSNKEFDHLVILTDVSFWTNEIDNLLAWCDQYGCSQKGMTVEIPNEDLLTAFCLRWS